MKNIYIIVALLLLVVITIFLFLGPADEADPEIINEVDPQTVDENDEQTDTREEDLESDNILDMQGYYLHIPDDYECTGGFTDGYRYVDAECTPKSGEDYYIVSERGLSASVVATHNTFSEMRSSLLNHDIDGVCEVYPDEPEIKLDAEHYICRHVEDGENVLTIGIGKNFGEYASHFAAHLKRDGEGEDEDLERLVNFLNRTIDIDWSNFAN